MTILVLKVMIKLIYHLKECIPFERVYVKNQSRITYNLSDSLCKIKSVILPYNKAAFRREGHYDNQLL